MESTMIVEDSYWYSHLQWKAIDLKKYFRRVHGCTDVKVLWMNIVYEYLQNTSIAISMPRKQKWEQKEQWKMYIVFSIHNGHIQIQ